VEAEEGNIKIIIINLVFTDCSGIGSIMKLRI